MKQLCFMLDRVARRLMEQRHIDLAVTESARERIAKLGYDPSYGARPIKRVIQTHILDPLSLKIVAGEIKEGKTVTIGTKNGEIVLSLKK